MTLVMARTWKTFRYMSRGKTMNDDPTDNETDHCVNERYMWH